MAIDSPVTFPPGTKAAEVFESIDLVVSTPERWVQSYAGIKKPLFMTGLLAAGAGQGPCKLGCKRVYWCTNPSIMRGHPLHAAYPRMAYQRAAYPAIHHSWPLFSTSHGLYQVNILFTIELSIHVISRGFAFNNEAYLRQAPYSAHAVTPLQCPCCTFPAMPMLQLPCNAHAVPSLQCPCCNSPAMPMLQLHDFLAHPSLQSSRWPIPIAHPPIPIAHPPPSQERFQLDFVVVLFSWLQAVPGNDWDRGSQ